MKIMQEFRYPARLSPDASGAITVTFRDLPEAITWGNGTNDALWQAVDCVEEAIAGRLRRSQSVPTPTRARRGEVLVDVPIRTAAKAALHAAMKNAHVSPSRLARKLDWDPKAVYRLLDPRLPATLSKLEQALNALGKRLVLAVDEAA